jgi:hypothetical protein
MSNMIKFSGLDTSDIALNQYAAAKDFSQYSKEFDMYYTQKYIKQLKRELYAHKLSTYCKRNHVLQTKDGFHIVELRTNEVKFDDNVWDNVFLVPLFNAEIGVQKGEKYGYYDSEVDPKEYLKYDGVYYYNELYINRGVMFSGTRYYRSPYLIVKKGVVYYEYAHPKTSLYKTITNPPNYSNLRQGKPKWVKYMKEEEFLSTRKGQ